MNELENIVKSSHHVATSKTNFSRDSTPKANFSTDSTPKANIDSNNSTPKATIFCDTTPNTIVSSESKLLAGWTLESDSETTPKLRNPSKKLFKEKSLKNERYRQSEATDFSHESRTASDSDSMRSFIVYTDDDEECKQEKESNSSSDTEKILYLSDTFVLQESSVESSGHSEVELCECPMLEKLRVLGTDDYLDDGSSLVRNRAPVIPHLEDELEDVTMTMNAKLWHQALLFSTSLQKRTSFPGYALLETIDEAHQLYDYNNEKSLIKSWLQKYRTTNPDTHFLERLLVRLKVVTDLLDTHSVSVHFGFVRNTVTGQAELRPRYALPLSLYDKLMPHQREGVAWMVRLHFEHAEYGGGLLADDMGLGKTIQVIVFLYGLFLRKKEGKPKADDDLKEIRHVLIVVPKGLLTNWAREYQNWDHKRRVLVFHGANGGDPLHALRRVQSFRSGILLTTYGVVRRYVSELVTNRRGSPFSWDYVILDEGHFIKNRTSQQFLAVRGLTSHHRLLLTGTPVQNRLGELWTLFDFLCQGRLLGLYRHFRASFEKAIEV
jgi:SNF2 family DNA or RNA helicase